VAYTWSHAIDHQSDALAGDYFDLLFTRVGSESARSEYATFSTQFDMRGDRGSADFDQRHNLVFFSIWDLPRVFDGRKLGYVFRDWRFSQLAAFRSGFPFSVRQSVTDAVNAISLFNARADVVDPAHVMLDPRAGAPGGERIVNPAAFAVAPSWRQGNSGRNAFRGPGFFSVDISLARYFSLPWLGEAGRLGLRADAFNLLNHSNLGNPQPLIEQPDFGVARYGRQGLSNGFPAVSPLNETARQIQLMLRLEF
jgi:hypothetical protein